MNTPLTTENPELPSEELVVGREFCVFDYAGVRYALPLAVIREVIRLPMACPITFSHESIIGMINLRGTPIPAVDAFAAVGMPGLRMKPLNMGITADWLVLDSSAPACMLIQQVGFVDKIPDEMIEPLGPESHPCIAGLTKTRGTDVIVLNEERILSRFEAMASRI